jgi:hypothetical protein
LRDVTHPRIAEYIALERLVLLNDRVATADVRRVRFSCANPATPANAAIVCVLTIEYPLSTVWITCKDPAFCKAAKEH